MIVDAAVDLIKHYESCRLTVYKDIAGHDTIGYGHMLQPGEDYTTITQEQADDLLRQDLVGFENSVRGMVAGYNATEDMIGALTSFCFNLGAGTLQSSSVLAQIKSDNMEKAAIFFCKFCKARDPETKELVPVNGLLRRRMSEGILFLTGTFDPSDV